MNLVETYFDLRRRGILLVWLGLIIVLSATILPALFQPPPDYDYSKLGIHLLIDDGRGHWDVGVWDEHIVLAGSMLPENGYVVELIQLDDLDVKKWQTFLNLTTEHNLQTIIRLATTFDYMNNHWTIPPADDDGRYTEVGQTYAEFIASLDWHTDKHYVILLNEPNHGNEWGGEIPDPSAYARFLVDVAQAIKSADPQAIILNGAFDLVAPHSGTQPMGDGFHYIDADTFIDGMLEEDPDVFSVVDIWNSHVYPKNFVEPPWVKSFGFDAVFDAPTEYIRPPAGIHNRGINGYEWELWKLATIGIDNLPVMITEIGWRHGDMVNPNSADAGEYPDVETITMYLDLALRGNVYDYDSVDNRYGGWEPLLLDGRVIAVIPFAFNGDPDSWSATNWLELSDTGEILGEYPMVELFRSYLELAEADNATN